MQGRIWQGVGKIVKMGLANALPLWYNDLTDGRFLPDMEDAMKLSLEQLGSIARGTDRVEAVDGGVQFFRMTEAQKGYYLHYNNIEKANKTDSTSGVRLAFYTDSQSVKFSANFTEGSSRAYAYFDIYENGAMIVHAGEEKENETSVEAKLLAGESLVEIYFPWSKGVVMTSFELDDGASIRPYVRSKTLVAYGDSITHGYDAIYPSLSYVNRLGNLLDADVFNRGIGGDVFAPELAKRDNVANVDYVTIAYGTNDWSMCTLEAFEANARGFFKVIHEKYSNSRVIVIAPIWRGDSERETAMKRPISDVYKLFCEYTKDYDNFTVVDGWNLIPHLSAFFHDQILHPNDQGFSLYAENLYKAIMKK